MPLEKPIDPYRIFFPLGIFLGFAGVIVWPLLYFGVISGYFGLSHAFLQSDGFLFCFIAGFLLTAIPRFTGTRVPSLTTQLVLAALVIIGAIAFELQSFAVGQIAFFVAYLVLVVLIVMRYMRRSGALPVTFSLVGVALLTGLIGALINSLTAWHLIDARWVLAGKRSLTEGMTLMLVLGVGGFLGPRLLGLNRLPLVQFLGVGEPKRRLFMPPPSYFYIIAGFILLLSILLEYGFDLSWMTFIRAFIATIVIAVTLEPWRLPAVRSTLSWCVWTSNWLLIAALWLVAILPVYRVDMMHVMFIGSFTLLILAVGMRVTLSHGGHGLATEVKNWPLRIGLICGTIAMLARAGAPFAPASYSQHLMWAALLWMIGLGIWGWRLIRLITKRN
ncbi:MAG: NnrS family protein [Bacteroidota bacterium]|nr:NnrS family protein [Bacteroidota bacterium]